MSYLSIVLVKLAKFFSGLLLGSPSTCSNLKSFFRLLLTKCLRVNFLTFAAWYAANVKGVYTSSIIVNNFMFRYDVIIYADRN